MAEIRPFRALHYCPERFPALSEVLPTTPGDAPPEALRADRERHPHALRHLEPGQLPPELSPPLHTAAREALEAWVSDGALRRLETPAFGVLAQQFASPSGVRSRLGLVAAVRLHDYTDRVILPHERTLRAPRESRAALLDALGAQLSPIFMLYADNTCAIEQHLHAATSREPIASFTDDEGVAHALHVLDDPECCQAIRNALAPHQLLIADGHHRYEAALAVQRARPENPAFPGRGWAMAYLANAFASGVEIQSTHRIVTRRNGLDAQQWLHDVAPLATVERCATTLDPRSLAACVAAPPADQQVLHVAVPPGSPAAGLYRLHPRTEAVAAAVRAHRLPAVAAEIPLMLLHDLLLPEFAGLSLQDQEQAVGIQYTHDTGAVWKALQDPATAFAVLLHPLSVHQLLAVANAGLFLPQKSTYFFPKVPAGLAMLDHRCPPSDDALR